MTRLMPHFSRGGIHGSSDRLSAVARANLRGASIFCVTHAETGVPLQRDSLPLISLFGKGVFLYSTILDAAASSGSGCRKVDGLGSLCDGADP
jgi:hypothetical protein